MLAVSFTMSVKMTAKSLFSKTVRNDLKGHYLRTAALWGRIMKDQSE
jgi:hypothetical protein